MTILLIAVLGGLGAATRFVVDGLVRHRRTTVLPVATVGINISGSALLGLLLGANLHHGLGDTWLLALGVGFCGGYTTFSTAMVETVRLLQTREYVRATANVLGTLVLCVAAAAAGVGLMGVLAG